MTLYSDPVGADSHRVRLVFAEKSIRVPVVDVRSTERLPDDLLTLNPRNVIPMLSDRELVVYHSHIIMEYLDERFPHPPLLPLDPVARARVRMTLHRIEHDWYSLLPHFESRSRGVNLEKSRQHLRESLISSAEVFSAKPYFLSDELSLVDCTIAPILWRLDSWEIPLETIGKPIANYADRLFRRPAFRASLTPEELRMRPEWSA
ncbi:MAG: glutathione S-transferase N-terminal domain-containing protein [Gammaproteobacteria bacterium]